MPPLMLQPELGEVLIPLKFEVSLSSLCELMPRLGEDKARTFVLPLNQAMAEFGISTAPRAAAFLAQLAHESEQLTDWVEDPHRHVVDGCRYCREHGPHAAGPQYEGRIKNLGNTQPGDGVRFIGRGPIQLTGRSNYEHAGRELGVDLARSPDLAASPAVGFRIAAWYWRDHGLNELADVGDFVLITKRINGGTLGLEERERYWAKAKELFRVA
jgi:predicted chitinase